MKKETKKRIEDSEAYMFGYNKAREEVIKAIDEVFDKKYLYLINSEELKQNLNLGDRKSN